MWSVATKKNKLFFKIKKQSFSQNDVAILEFNKSELDNAGKRVAVCFDGLCFFHSNRFSAVGDRRFAASFVVRLRVRRLPRRP
jgi:hypothetical protein